MSTLRMLQTVVAAATLAVAVHAQAGPPTPAGSAFTYQGLFKDGGLPATGTYHLRFQLWNDLAGGAQVGSDIDVPALSVTEGLFTVALDFGVEVFDGSARWLQIQVITNGGATVTTLSPRQSLTSAPYALQTRGIFVNNAGLVGIGTTDPLSDLHVRPAGLAGNVRLGGPGGVPGVVGIANNGNRRDIRFTDAGIGLFTRNSSATPVAGNGLFIDESGRAGIGTVAPTATLHAVNPSSADLSTAILGNASNISGETIGVHGITSSAEGVGVRGDTGGGPGSAIGGLFTSFADSGTAILAIAAANSGGGTTGLRAEAFSSNGIAVQAAAVANSGTTVGLHATVNSANGYAGLFEGGRNHFSGNVGLGVLDPTFRLHLSTNSAAKPTSNTWTISSDARLKKNIQPIAHALDDLLALRGVTYQWKDPESQGNMSGTYTGMIAQDVEQVFPEWISEDSRGYKHLTVIGFEGLVVEALRELRAENDDLRARVETLERLVEQLLICNQEAKR